MTLLSTDENDRYHAISFENRLDPGNKLIRTFQALSTDSGAT